MITHWKKKYKPIHELGKTKNQRSKIWVCRDNKIAKINRRTKRRDDKRWQPERWTERNILSELSGCSDVPPIIEDIFARQERVLILPRYQYDLFTFIEKHEDKCLRTEEGERLALIILYHVLSALAYAHERGICHRDIKLGNVFITIKSGCKMNVVLGDWEFAKHFKKGKKFKGWIGTPHCVSPQMQNDRCYDPEKNDIWATGVLLFELITTRKLWHYGKVDVDHMSSYRGRYSPCQEVLSFLLTIDEEKRPTGKNRNFSPP
jgi:serine/threonine protein kinase